MSEKIVKKTTNKKRPVILAVYLKKNVADYVIKLAKTSERTRSYVVEKILEERMSNASSTELL